MLISPQNSEGRAIQNGHAISRARRVTVEENRKDTVCKWYPQCNDGSPATVQHQNRRCSLWIIELHTHSTNEETRARTGKFWLGLKVLKHWGTLLSLATPCGMWDLSSLTRDWTCAPCRESQPLDHQGNPYESFWNESQHMKTAIIIFSQHFQSFMISSFSSITITHLLFQTL